MPRLVRRVTALMVLIVALLGTSSASADQRLQVPGSNLLGFSVALSSDGGTALVGAPNTDAGQGAAYVFNRIGGFWLLQQKLRVAHPPQLGALRFGTSVSLSSDGRTALIGAQGSNPAIGGEDTAFVFTRNLAGLFFIQQQLPNPAGTFSGNEFGAAVSLSSDGRAALVGAPAPGQGGSGGGAVYVFARGLVGGWTPGQTLRAAGSTDFDGFGSSVSLSGDGRTALIGAPAQDDTGTAYVFARSLVGAFAQTQSLTAADRASGDGFGRSVALSGDGTRALIGAPDKDDGAKASAGAAYVFARALLGGFTQQQRLQASVRATGDAFGNAVAFDRTAKQALIGAQGTDDERGAAYRFTRGFTGPFTQSQLLRAPVRASGDFFGWSVAATADGGIALVGAPEISSGTGSAYVFNG